jgi:hypothetical protein
MRPIRIALLAGFALATASPASSTPGQLSAAAYRNRANATCAKEQLASVTRLHTAKGLAQYLAEEVPVLRAALADLTALDPPRALTSLQGQILTTIHGELSVFVALAQRAKAGNLTVAQWQGNTKLAQLDARELALWKQAGATTCASP